MDNSRQKAQNTFSVLSGRPASSLNNYYGQVQIDDSHADATEATTKSLSYWPPSSLPSDNFFKQRIEDIPVQTSEVEHPLVSKDSKILNPNTTFAFRNKTGKSEEETVVYSGVSSLSSSSLSSSSINSSNKILLHQLPPIAGITSHNHRGTKEVSQNLQQDSAELTTKSAEEKSKLCCDYSNKSLTNCHAENSTEPKAYTESRENLKPQKEVINLIQNNASEIIKLPQSPLLGRTEATNPEFLGTDAANIHKIVSSSQTSTQIVGTPTTTTVGSRNDSYEFRTDTYTNLSSYSSSVVPGLPNNFIDVSPNESSVQCSPSHENALGSHFPSKSPSLSASNIKMSSLAPPPSLHPIESFRSNINVSSQQVGSSSSPNLKPPLKIPVLCDSKKNINSSAQGVHPDSSRPRFSHDFVDQNRKNQMQQNKSIKSSFKSNSLQMNEQTEKHPSKNNFNLTVPKGFPLQYSHESQQEQHYLTSNHLPLSMYSQPGSFVNHNTISKAFRNSSESESYSSNMQQTKADSEERRSDKYSNISYSKLVKSRHEVSNKECHMTDNCSNESVIEQGLPHDYSKYKEMSANNSNFHASSFKPIDSVAQINDNLEVNVDSRFQMNFSTTHSRNVYNRRENESSYLESQSDVCFQQEGFQSSTKGLLENFSNSSSEKSSENFNNSKTQSKYLPLKYPPVLKSNFDLNKQIHNTMKTNRLVGLNKSLSVPKEQNILQISEENHRLKCFDYEKARTSLIENLNYTKQEKILTHPNQTHMLNSHGHCQPYPESCSKSSNKFNSSSVNEDCNSLEMVSLSSKSEAKIPQMSSLIDNSRHSTFGTSHQISSCQTNSPEKEKLISSNQNSLFSHKKLDREVSQYLINNSLDEKIKYPISQSAISNNVHDLTLENQRKGKNSQSPVGPSVSSQAKRESPLDLSVKTVRQSADSTAKDDSEAYHQNMRHFHRSHHSSYPDNSFSSAQVNNPSVGPPKIDFNPNFSGFNNENYYSTTSLQKKIEIQILPSVDSFKKLPERLGTLEIQDSKVKENFSLSNSFPLAVSNGQKPTNKDSTLSAYHQGRDIMIDFQKNTQNELHRNQLSLAKLPKIDPWKLAFDRQIEQRLNSARTIHQNNQNSQNMEVSKQLEDKMKQPKVPVCHNFQSANMFSPVNASNAPYSPAFVKQSECHCVKPPQTLQEKVDPAVHTGHSPDTELIIKQISKGVMPDYKLLQDKNVINILRSSLEEKEAKLMQLKEAAKKKEKNKELDKLETSKKFNLSLDKPVKSSEINSIKPSLPSFGALTLERMCVPQIFPNPTLNLPKSVENFKIDTPQKYFTSTFTIDEAKSGISISDSSQRHDTENPPADLDGLAAFLAARIRTKGELKQVDTVSETISAVSNQYSKSHSNLSTSNENLPNQQLSNPNTSHFSNTSSKDNFSKQIKESPPTTSLKRRLFTHAEGVTPTTSGQNSECELWLSRNKNGMRSSSETSVFDFKESDSESEMPILERQSLEEMRRDRKVFGSKQSVCASSLDEVAETNKVESVPDLDKSHPDPFWDTAFEMFVEQLEKRPPKRCVRKKKVTRVLPEETESNGLEIGQSDKCLNPDPDSSLSVSKLLSETDSSCEESLIKERSNPKAQNKIDSNEIKTDSIVNTQIKFSSSPLKNAKENLIKNRKVNEVKGQAKLEKSCNVSEKLPKNNKKREKNEVMDDNNLGPVKKKKKETITKRKANNVEHKIDSDEEKKSYFKSDSESSSSDDDNDSYSLSISESESSDSEISNSESSDSNYSNSVENDNEKVSTQRIQTRQQTRNCEQRQVKSTGMRLRSKALSVIPSAPLKSAKEKNKSKTGYFTSEKKKKPSFGDGSAFRPGWEEECYKFKQQLRMPEKLICISRPPKRSSASLPDLEPYKNSCDAPLNKKPHIISDAKETVDNCNKHKSKSNREFLPDSEKLSSLFKFRKSRKSQSNSVLNMLVNKYGKESTKKQKELKVVNERKSARTLPSGTNRSELIPSSHVGMGKENVLTSKKKMKDTGKKKLDDVNTQHFGYFRKKPISNINENFKQAVNLLPQELNSKVLKSRTRMQTRDKRKKETLIEVFGDDRPASAPPLISEDVKQNQEKVEKVEKAPEKDKPKNLKKVSSGVVTRGRGKLMRSGRPGLRSTAVHRSNKAVHISKRHLNCSRKRNLELLRVRAIASKKFSYLVTSSDGSNQHPITKKRLKLKSVRRKFRSGFDYIRKKKKLKKDVDSAEGSVKEKKFSGRPTSESVEDIQNEIKNWVINKGLGETILHRAARLGYTDVAAYCLEKMDCSPSPRDNAGYTPLHEACSRGHLEIAKLLLMYGASVSESAKGGIRPLHEAAENGFTELIRLLLSFGADPLLETYAGHTALSLVTDDEARRLIQHHLADVQGNVAPVWSFQGPSSIFDPPDSGFDPLSEPPSPEPLPSDFELEISDTMLPPLYRLTTDCDSDRRWVLMKDLISVTKARSKDSLLKQLKSPSVLEMKLSDFYEQGKCCSLLNTEKAHTKSSKILLVCYDNKIRQLMNVEKVVL